MFREPEYQQELDRPKGLLRAFGQVLHQRTMHLAPRRKGRKQEHALTLRAGCGGPGIESVGDYLPYKCVLC